MIWITQRLESLFRPPDEGTLHALQLLMVALAAGLFVLVSTVIVAFEDLVPSVDDIASLRVGDIAQRDIRAPRTLEYVSRVLTEERQQEARNSVADIYFPPDPGVARQQAQLARQILDFLENVRRDPFATLEQKSGDVRHITALTLDDAIIRDLLEMNDDTWGAMDDEIVNVLERVMQDDIRESTLSTVMDQLPTQVSVRFGPQEAEVITAIVADLVRPNTFLNPTATEQAREQAAASIEEPRRVFERGQIVVREGTRIDPIAYEALEELDLLEQPDRRLQEITSALLASIMVMVVVGLYIARFRPSLFGDARFLALLAALFLLVLLGARLTGLNEQLYIYPTATLGLLYVALIGPEIAIIGILALALLIGLMASSSLEIAALIITGGLIGILTLRRAERLNSYFFAGLMVALTNTVIVTLFNLQMLDADQGITLSTLILYSLVNGILSAAAALAVIYILTLLFNLPTGLKLVELSQPSQPLLQRLLREAPGTYQHSLQVANLSEQAATAIGASAELVHVAALYHDIGKMLNPAFFVENQVEAVNPHDFLNDPYRSADIIISHVTEGDKLARQYRLPRRIRDFILEHHGTTQVAYFYRQAVEKAGGDETAVDIEQFTYPGPHPRSRETAIMMLADSCESTVRARRPTSKQEIADIVQQIFDNRVRDGQLDESGLTLNDLKAAKAIFVDMLQAVFHPRINYPTFVRQQRPEAQGDADVVTDHASIHTDNDKRSETLPTAIGTETKPARPKARTGEVRKVVVEDDAPVSEVPRLPRTGEYKAIKSDDNDKKDNSKEAPGEPPGERKTGSVVDDF